MSPLRRISANTAALVFMFLFLGYWFRPSNRFPQLDAASLALHWNSSQTVQRLHSFAADLAPECDVVVESIISTRTETQYITATATATETATCPRVVVEAATRLPAVEVPPIHVPSSKGGTVAAKEPTAEQETVARLRDQGIVIIFKTGAQEVSHLSIQVGTTLRYLDPADILFFSDLQGSIGPFLIHDALRNVDQTLKESDADFQIYRDIRRYQRTGQDIEELKEERSKGDGRAGWRLDKYKFLHMVEETFEMRPNAKWYVFIETDSYVVWSNLAEWLGRLDSTKPMYMGAPVFIGGTAFGHGGSGYVLSNAAMNKLLGSDQPQELAAKWDKKMKDVCCGDFALAVALKEKGIEVSGAYPLTNGDKPATMSFGPNQLWCAPVVTMHHVLPHEISAIWRYERKREILDTNSNGTTFADLYFHFVEPLFVESRDNWDNMSQGKTFSEEQSKEIEAKMLEEQEKLDEEDRKTDEARKKNEEDKKLWEQKKLEEAKKNDQNKKLWEQKKLEEAKKNDEARRKNEESKQKLLDEKIAASTAASKETERKQKAMEEDAAEREKEGGDTDPSKDSKDVKQPAKDGETLGSEKGGKDDRTSDAIDDKKDDKKDGEKDGEKDQNKDGEKDENKDDKKDEEKDKTEPGPKEEEKKPDLKLETRKVSQKPAPAPAPGKKPYAKRREITDDRPDVEKEAHLSFENCAKACEAYDRCFQYVYSEKVCTLGESFRLGKYAKPDRGDRIVWRSGWKLSRIRKWTMENPCAEPEWPSWVGPGRLSD